MIRSMIRWISRSLRKREPWHDELFVDPIFGECWYSSASNRWITLWQLSENRQITIMGRSERPTSEQAVLWHQVQERMLLLMREANASIPDPPVTNFTPAVIKRDGIELSEVRFESDGTVQFFLNLTITDSNGYDLCPQIVFRDWQIIDSGWCV